MSVTANKKLELALLATQLVAAGITFNGLGTVGQGVYTFDSNGTQIDLPPAAQAVVDAHTAPVPVDLQDASLAQLDTDMAAVANLADAKAALRKFAQAFRQARKS